MTKALDALMSIEGFRSLNQDIQTIINKSEAVKKAKKDAEKMTPKEKRKFRRGKGIQVPSEADSRKAYQVCYPHSNIYVPYRLSRAVTQRCYNSA